MTKDPSQEVLNICSDGDTSPTERDTKRHRKEFRQKQQTPLIDLSGDSPDGSEPAGSARSARLLWGEVEGPPRWNNARSRRSALRQPSELFNAEATTSAPTTGWPSPRGNRLGLQRAEEPLHTPASRGPTRQVRPYRPPCAPPVLICNDSPAPRSRARGDAAVARRLQEREDAASARQAAEASTRQMEEEELARRMDFYEAMEEELMQSGVVEWDHPVPARGGPPQSNSQRRYEPVRGSRVQSLAETMMGMLTEGRLTEAQLGQIHQHMAAARHAFSSMSEATRLPIHLLCSDRDFDENDYEALLALDENVASRKGATLEQIESIPTIVVGSGGVKAEEDARCPICLEDLVPGVILRRMVCKHHFHKGCLDRWLAHKSVCPICQQKSCS